MSSKHAPGQGNLDFCSSQPETLALEGAQLLFWRHFPLTDADGLLDTLIAETPWQQENITIYGKSHPQPRLEAWYGDPGAEYSYSGIHHLPLPWTHTLSILRDTIGTACGQHFNSVLLNYYRDGNDAMGLHADDEAELGAEPVIASLSLGAERRMYFRHKQHKSIEGLALDLPHQSLLVMAGATQENWKHGIRRTARDCGPRVNLTFRNILQ